MSMFQSMLKLRQSNKQHFIRLQDIYVELKDNLFAHFLFRVEYCCKFNRSRVSLPFTFHQSQLFFSEALVDVSYSSSELVVPEN